MGMGEMALWLRALAEELDLVPSTHVIAYNHPQLQFKEI